MSSQREPPRSSRLYYYGTALYAPEQLQPKKSMSLVARGPGESLSPDERLE